jgi:hypothetical protein
MMTFGFLLVPGLLVLLALWMMLPEPARTFGAVLLVFVVLAFFVGVQRGGPVRQRVRIERPPAAVPAPAPVPAPVPDEQ